MFNLEVQVIEAQLQKADFHRKASGLACVASIVSETKEKKQKKNSEYVDDMVNPKWDAKFSFSSVESSDTLRVKIEDKPSFGPPHSYGKVNVSISSLSNGGTFNQEYEVGRKKRRPFGDNEFGGKIKLIIQVTRVEKSEERLKESLTSSLSVPQLKPDLTSSGEGSIGRDRSPLRMLNRKLDVSPKRNSPKALRASGGADSLTSLTGSSSSNPALLTGSTSSLRTSHSSSAAELGAAAPRISLGSLNNPFLCQLLSVPSDESFFAVVRCSYFSPILIHGSLYFSTNYICFFSRFLGKITQEVINIDNILAVTKKLSNSNIIIQTRSKSYNLLSFRRVDLYTLVLKAWKREGIDLTSSAEIEDEIGVNEILSTEQGEDGLGFWNSKISLTPIVEAEFPLSPPVFFKKFFDDSFTRLFYERRGATEINIDPWTKSDKYGMFREISYRLPVDRFGVAVSTVNATQRYNLQKDHLLLVSTYVLRDLPFGDICTLEGKWDIKEISPKQIRLTGFHVVNKTAKGVTNSQEAWLEKIGTDHFENWVALARGELVKWKTAKQKLRTQSKDGAVAAPPVKTTNSAFLRFVDKFPIYMITFLCVGCVIGVIWIWGYLSYVERKAARLHCALSPDVDCQISVESFLS